MIFIILTGDPEQVLLLSDEILQSTGWVVQSIVSAAEKFNYHLIDVFITYEQLVPTSW